MNNDHAGLSLEVLARALLPPGKRVRLLDLAKALEDAVTGSGSCGAFALGRGAREQGLDLGELGDERGFVHDR